MKQEATESARAEHGTADPREESPVSSELCSKGLPKALALHGHQFWAGSWGVLIGVTRCAWCNVVASDCHFPPRKGA